MVTNLFVKRTVFLLCSVILLDMSCTNNEAERPDCDKSDLAIELTSDNPNTCSSADGSISAEGDGGTGSYKFSINGGAFTDNSTFSGLAAGIYTIAVRDKNGCVREEQITLSSPGSTLAIDVTHENAECGDPTGSISAEGSGGTGPYTYKINNGAFGVSPEFTDLAAGTYTVTMKDANGCTTASAAIRITTGVSYVNDIKPLIENRCDHCHGPGGIKADRDWTVYANVKTFAANIKALTSNGTMPADLAGTGGLPQNERDLIACWVDDGALNN